MNIMHKVKWLNNKVFVYNLNTMKKEIYNRPRTRVTTITLSSMILVGSPATSNNMNVNTGVETDDQW